MGKKRRVWWLVGSVGLLVLAFGTVGSMISLQERLQREVRAVVRDYGFVETDRFGPLYSNAGRRPDHEHYDAKGLDESNIEKIFERFDSACNNCERHPPLAGRWQRSWYCEDSPGVYVSLRLSRGRDDGVVSMDVVVNTRSTSSPWDPFRSWWPW